MITARDIEVIVEYLPSSAGGKSSPVKSGYRPQFYYRCHDWDGEHEYPDAEWIKPGDRARAYIRFLSPKEHLNNLSVGTPFLIREGQHVVGFGSVTAIIDLPKSASKNDDG